MRTWYKYIVTDDASLAGKTVHNPTDDYIDVMASLDRDAFLAHGRTFGSSQVMIDFLRRNLDGTDKAISIGAGNGEYEIHLVLDGYDILITDVLDGPMAVTRQLFPEAKTRNVDIIADDFDVRYADLLGTFDAVFVASLFYWLEDRAARTAVRNMKALLKPGGRLLVVFRSKNTALTWLVDDVICRFERPLNALKRRLATGKPHYVFRNFAGYRRSLAEIRAILTDGTGLSERSVEFASPHKELERSAILRTLRLPRVIGPLVPRYGAYHNMFVLDRHE